MGNKEGSMIQTLYYIFLTFAISTGIFMILSAFKIRTLNNELKELRQLLNHIAKKPGRHRKKVITNKK